MIQESLDFKGCPSTICGLRVCEWSPCRVVPLRVAVTQDPNFNLYGSEASRSVGRRAPTNAVRLRTATHFNVPKKVRAFSRTTRAARARNTPPPPPRPHHPPRLPPPRHRALMTAKRQGCSAPPPAHASARGGARPPRTKTLFWLPLHYLPGSRCAGFILSLFNTKTHPLTSPPPPSSPHPSFPAHSAFPSTPKPAPNPYSSPPHRTPPHPTLSPTVFYFPFS